MKERNLKNLIVLLLTLPLLILGCEKEAELAPEMGFGGYPKEVTLENWESFVHAPQAVIDHHRQLELNLVSPTEEAAPAEVALAPPGAYSGFVRYYTSASLTDPCRGIWTSMPNTVVEAINVPFCETTNLNYPKNFCHNTPGPFASVRWHYLGKNVTYSVFDWVKGVSAMDMVLIQRHIGNIEKFCSTRQVIAADVDLDGYVSGEDINLIQKLLLGNITAFPSTPSVSCAFLDQPFHYMNDDDYEYLNENEECYGELILNYFSLSFYTQCPSFLNPQEINAYAIKRGDVSGNWTP